MIEKELLKKKDHKNVDSRVHDSEQAVFTHIYHFSMGTLDYHMKGDFKETRYVAMFPYQYTLDDNQGRKYQMQAKCTKVKLGAFKKKKGSEFEYSEFDKLLINIT